MDEYNNFVNGRIKKLTNGLDYMDLLLDNNYSYNDIRNEITKKFGGDSIKKINNNEDLKNSILNNIENIKNNENLIENIGGNILRAFDISNKIFNKKFYDNEVIKRGGTVNDINQLILRTELLIEEKKILDKQKYILHPIKELYSNELI